MNVITEVIHFTFHSRSFIKNFFFLSFMNISFYHSPPILFLGLQGLDKKETVAKYGKDMVQVWRRSYDIPPPVVDKTR